MYTLARGGPYYVAWRIDRKNGVSFTKEWIWCNQGVGCPLYHCVSTANHTAHGELSMPEFCVCLHLTFPCYRKMSDRTNLDWFWLRSASSWWWIWHHEIAKLTSLCLGSRVRMTVLVSSFLSCIWAPRLWDAAAHQPCLLLISPC